MSEKDLKTKQLKVGDILIWNDLKHLEIVRIDEISATDKLKGDENTAWMWSICGSDEKVQHLLKQRGRQFILVGDGMMISSTEENLPEGIFAGEYRKVDSDYPQD